MKAHDQVSLAQHLPNRLLGSAWRQRWRHLFKQEIDVADVSVSAGPVILGNFSPKRGWRRLTLGSRFYAAAIEWLRPDPDGFLEGAYPISGLKALKRRVSLDHWHDHDFARELHAKCSEIGHAHQDLRPWIDCRNALLEYGFKPPEPLPRELVQTTLLLERSQMAAMYNLSRDPAEAVKVASVLLNKSLEGAIAACCWTVSRERSERPTDCTANLMLPISRSDMMGLEAKFDAGWTVNDTTARALWSGVRHDQRLVVVSETPPGPAGKGRGGFWVPIARGDGGHPIPGATAALVTKRGCGVFKQDLPPCRGFPEVMASRWRAYMMEHFEHTLFVSLPTVVTTEDGGLEVAAVLNINISPPAGDKTWNRAYHSTWLDVASDAVATFARHAFWATRILLEASEKKIGGPDTLGFLNPGVGPLPQLVSSNQNREG